MVVPKGYGTREERKLLSSVPGCIPYFTGAFLLFGRASLVSALSESSRDAGLTQKPDIEYRDHRVYQLRGDLNQCSREFADCKTGTDF